MINNSCPFIVVLSTYQYFWDELLCFGAVSCESNGVRRLLGAVIYANQSDTRLNSERVAIELGQLVFFAKPLSNN